jgi:hypothetical protein
MPRNGLVRRRGLMVPRRNGVPLTSLCGARPRNTAPHEPPAPSTMSGPRAVPSRAGPAAQLLESVAHEASSVVRPFRPPGPVSLRRPRPLQAVPCEAPPHVAAFGPRAIASSRPFETARRLQRSRVCREVQRPRLVFRVGHRPPLPGAVPLRRQAEDADRLVHHLLPARFQCWQARRRGFARVG